MEWEKIFANYISAQGLISKYPEYIKNSYNSTTKNPNNSINKWAKDLNRHFFKEDIQMADKHMKDAQRH